MDTQGFTAVFEEAKQQSKLDFSDFRADPAYHFILPVRHQITEPDLEAIKIAAGHNIDLFIQYLKLPKPEIGYQTVKYHPMDTVDSRHVMMSIIAFGELGNIETVTEIGGGFGNWARMNLQLYPNIKQWNIIDLKFVQDLQQWYLNNSLDLELYNKINFIDAEETIQPFHTDLMIGAHSLSEVSLDYFLKYLPLLEKSKYIFYARHQQLPNADLSRMKVEILMSKFELVRNIRSEYDRVDNMLFRNKNY